MRDRMTFQERALDRRKNKHWFGKDWETDEMRMEFWNAAPMQECDINQQKIADLPPVVWVGGITSWS